MNDVSGTSLLLDFTPQWLSELPSEQRRLAIADWLAVPFDEAHLDSAEFLDGCKVLGRQAFAYVKPDMARKQLFPACSSHAKASCKGCDALTDIVAMYAVLESHTVNRYVKSPLFVTFVSLCYYAIFQQLEVLEHSYVVCFKRTTNTMNGCEFPNVQCFILQEKYAAHRQESAITHWSYLNRLIGSRRQCTSIAPELESKAQ